MAWDLDSDRPIYSQIIEIVQMQIISGKYLPGEKLPSVRILASEASVNPNTMQKALSELEKSGLIITKRTSGRIVTEDNQMIQLVRKDLATTEITTFFEKMKNLGFDKDSILSLIQNILKEETNEFITKN